MPATKNAKGQYRRRKPVRRRVARNALVTKHLGLLYAFVIKRHKQQLLHGMTFDEAISAGTLGLIRAAELWEKGRAAFSTYATYWIHQAIGEEMRGRSRKPLGIPISEAFGKENDELNSMFACKHDGPEVETQRTEAIGAAHRLLEGLPDRYRRAVHARCIEQRTLKDVGKILGGICRERARQVVELGLRYMRAAAREQGLRWDGRNVLDEVV